MGDVFRMPDQYSYHGLAFPRGPYPPDHMDKARDVGTRDGDVVVLSYPRTGEGREGKGGNGGREGGGREKED